jgi:hypothetical protein
MHHNQLSKPRVFLGQRILAIDGGHRKRRLGLRRGPDKRCPRRDGHRRKVRRRDFRRSDRSVCVRGGMLRGRRV